MATPLPAAATTAPNALRSAIIARLGIDPKKLVGFGGDMTFDNAVTDLYRQATGQYAALDINQNRVGQDYENYLAQLNQAKSQDENRLNNDLADRGLSFSGAAIIRRAQAASDYANKLQSLNTNKLRGYEDIATSRNNVLNSLLSGRSAQEAGYTSQLQDFLQKQAQAAAQTALNQPVTP